MRTNRFGKAISAARRRLSIAMMGGVLLAAVCWSDARAQQFETASPPSENFLAAGATSADIADAAFPSTTPPLQSGAFGDKLATIGKTIGQDELHIIKAPFKKSAIKWDIAMVLATGALIATDERVIHDVPTSWHQTGLDISDSGTYGMAAIAGGIYLTGLITKDQHAQQTGILTAEATADSVIFYGVMKAITQRQRPYTGAGEGRFFSGNWTNGSFPSGHSMFAWTIASTIAHQYHSVPLKILLYGIATTVSTTRVTAGQHFPSDVFVGSIFGYLIGDFVAHKPASDFPVRSQGKAQRVENAVLQHVTIGAQF
jgi:membrane-associated phospholipid phosphatase